MVSHRIFKRVLAEYFRFILTREQGCGNECCIQFPTIWFDLIYLEDYFSRDDIPKLEEKYFKQINPYIKEEILKIFPNLEPYFNESLWYRRDESTMFIPNYRSIIPDNPTQSDNVLRISSSSSIQNSPVGSRASSPIPTISVYRSSGTQSIQNSPVGSRASSPIPTISEYRSLCTQSTQNSPVESSASTPINNRILKPDAKTLKRIIMTTQNYLKTSSSDSVFSLKPTTSGYRSPGTRSLENSPVGSRSTSPIPENIPINQNVRSTGTNSQRQKKKTRKSSITSESPHDKNRVSSSKPTTSGYRSPGTRSLQNSPVGSRANSPAPENVTINQNVRSTSTKSQRQKKTAPKPKRKYRKRLKLYTYMNQFPETLHDLQPHESNLLLQGIDGREINDLNLPLPICKTIRKQCRVLNPKTKRYSAYGGDDNSENLPLNIVLKY